MSSASSPHNMFVVRFAHPNSCGTLRIYKPLYLLPSAVFFLSIGSPVMTKEIVKKVRDIRAEIAKKSDERKEIVSHRGTDKSEEKIEYWDGELDSKGKPADRDIHLINITDGKITKWFIKDKKIRKRETDHTYLWDELSDTRLGPLEEKGTRGRFATEKLEKAIKMHCPLPHLQPLVRL